MSFTGMAVSLSFECMRCLETSVCVECVTSALSRPGAWSYEQDFASLSHIRPEAFGRRGSCKMSNSPSQKLVFLYPCGKKCCLVCVCLNVCVCGGVFWVLTVTDKCRSDLAQIPKQSKVSMTNSCN